ncbi:MAG: FAD-dependent oxidoreductase [Micropruina glycogenica]
MDSIVIIGGGLCAANAVETLRDEGFTGPLTVVAAEPLLPYERPPLSKDVLQGTAEFEVLHDAQWYAERDTRVITGQPATGLDLGGRTVTLADGTELHYDKLLLTTGAEPCRLEIPVRSGPWCCARAATNRCCTHRYGGARLVIIGGGWIALEVAASARQNGADVTVLVRGEAPLADVLGRQLSDHLVALQRAHGVDVRTSTTVTEITATGVETSDGPLAADVVLAAIGVAPSTTLAEAAGLAVSDGVITDSSLRTSDPHVWAAGDLALGLNTALGPLRVEHWDNAIRQGKLAARAMLGHDVTYDWQPYFFTDQFEFSMEYVGHGSPSDTVEIRGDLDGNEFIAYWLGGADGRTVTAGMNVGIWDVNDTLRAMIGTSVNPDELTDLR